MINNGGVQGYILKDSKPAILKEAFDSISSKGFYSNDLASSKMMHYVNNEEKEKKKIHTLRRHLLMKKKSLF